MLASMLDTHACMWHAPYVLPRDEARKKFRGAKKKCYSDLALL
jgi:hypothetical protein